MSSPRNFNSDPDICRCGHSRAQHGEEGVCELYAEPIPDGEPKPGFCRQYRQPTGTCWCNNGFNGEPWPWRVWGICTTPKANEDGTYTLSFGDADHYKVAQDGNPKQYGPYKTEAAAKRKADELNREMVQGPLDPEFKARRDRLKKLAPYFGSWTHTGPAEARWPVRPDRYLAFGYQDAWHGEDYTTLYATLEAVREALEDPEGNEIGRVVDLDTGEDVKFERTISVSFG